ncbi:MAG: hypothetical protein JNM93_09730 [Bacteriovoracaceae bacterium]|nr:hypothetical protein [Bacteriovoracaceae bacterium]
MDAVSAIFTQLGADASVICQFAVVIILFLLTKFVFLNRLQSVIETREAKTSKLEGSADSQFLKAEEVQKTYQEKIEKAYKEAQLYSSQKKNEVIKERDKLVKETEKEVTLFIEKSRHENVKELNERKVSLFNEADSLASSLVDKMIH